MDHIIIFNKLNTILNNKAASLNIILVLFKIRHAFWYDYWDLNIIKFKKLIKYLDLLEKYGIKYIYPPNIFNKKKIINEGPLIYNYKIINKSILKKIENLNNINIIYDTTLFGKLLLGDLNCCLINVDKNKQYYKNSYSISFDLLEQIQDKNNKNVTNINNIGWLYGFSCNIDKLQLNSGKIFSHLNKINKILSIINSNYYVIMECTKTP